MWIAGPGLRHAEREVIGLHERWGGQLLIGSVSTVDNVLAALDGARIAHIAAHGRFRADAPAFSYLELADGPLHGYDLRHPPHLLVLSACESASLAQILLARGARAVIASTSQVDDESAVEFMVTLHEHLDAGPAQALARAQKIHGDRGFVCIGAG